MSAEHPFGYIKDGKVFLKAFLSFPERELGEAKSLDNNAFQYFEEKFTLFNNKVEEIKNEIASSENKGSFLMKTLHLKEQITSYIGLGDYESLLKTLELLESQIQQGISENRKRNLEVKKVLLEEIKAIIARQTWEKDREEIKGAQQRWVRIGRVSEEDEEEIEGEYKRLLESFFDELKEHINAKKEVHALRLAKYQELLDHAKALSKQPINKENILAFQTTQKQWKEIGQVPKNALNKLWDEFKEIGNQYFDNLKKGKSNSKNKNKDIGTILKEKEALVADAKALHSLGEVNALSKTVQELKDTWRSLGKVNNKAGKELQTSFYDACNFVDEYLYIYKRTSTFVKNLEEQSPEDKNKALSITLRKSIQKDQDEINRYEDNAANMNVFGNSGFGKLVDSTLDSKKRMLTIKKSLLDYLKK